MNDWVLDEGARQALAELTWSALRTSIEPPEARNRDERASAHERCRELARAHPVLAEPAGAFVTVYVDGELRGCLGEIEPADALAEVVWRCATRTPRYDRRFDPVRPDELPRLHFKVSVLSPPRRVAALEEIEVGRHGLLVRHDGLSGLLLPDVPTEYGWDLPAFLAGLWRKAGLNPKIPWTAAQLWLFTSEVIDGGPAESPRHG